MSSRRVTCPGCGRFMFTLESREKKNAEQATVVIVVGTRCSECRKDQEFVVDCLELEKK